jgi:hypothetical protein
MSARVVESRQLGCFGDVPCRTLGTPFRTIGESPSRERAPEQPGRSAPFGVDILLRSWLRAFCSREDWAWASSSLDTTADGNPLPTTRAQLLVDIGIVSSFIGIFNPSPPNPGVPSTRVDVDWLGVTATSMGRGARVNRRCSTASPTSSRVRGLLEHRPRRESLAEQRHARWQSQTGSFINTGVHLLANYDYHFDAVNGRVGFRPHREPASGVR